MARRRARSGRRREPARRSAGRLARYPRRCRACRRLRRHERREGVGRRLAWRHVRLTTKQTLGREARHAEVLCLRAGGEAVVSVEVNVADGIAEVVIDFPPVNALPVRGWYDLAAAVTRAGADPGTRVVVLAAEGRGFCAGVDIKEMQRTPGNEALLGANGGRAAAFAAVYDCAVPVIAAVHGFCL